MHSDIHMCVCLCLDLDAHAGACYELSYFTNLSMPEQQHVCSSFLSAFVHVCVSLLILCDREPKIELFCIQWSPDIYKPEYEYLPT